MHSAAKFLLYFGIFSAAAAGTKIVSFNTGLTPKVRYYEDRLEEMVPALEDLNADILCLQEVWFSSAVTQLVQNLETLYPYSYSAVHNGVGHLQEVSPIESPCGSTKFLLEFLPCLSLHCSDPSGETNYLTCAEKTCGLLDLEQHCISCLVMTDTAEPVHRCFLDLGNRFNSGGLLLLSKYPLSDVNVTRFEPDKKLVLPRGYVSAQVENLGKVVCTHTAANLGPVYFEKLHYTSWEHQNVAETRAMLQLTESHDHAVILGDLNSSPSVPEHYIEEDMPAALSVLNQAGFTAKYMDEVGLCTWCTYNALAHAQKNHILDHIFTKGLAVTSAQRVLDDIRVRGRYPLSDHYGIEVTVDIDSPSP